MVINTKVGKNLEENIHHIFTYEEVRKKMVEIFGKPETDLEHKFIQQETFWAWKRMPCYKIPIEKHNLIHIEEAKRKRIRRYKLVLNGLNSLKSSEEIPDGEKSKYL